MAEPYVCTTSSCLTMNHRHTRICRGDMHIDIVGDARRIWANTSLRAVCQESLRFPMRTISDTSTSLLLAHRNPHTKVSHQDSVIRAIIVVNMSTLGGIFKLELFLPDDYPMTPPKIRFLTKIFHPNIDKLGRICLDVLKSMPLVDASRVYNYRACN